MLSSEDAAGGRLRTDLAPIPEPTGRLDREDTAAGRLRTELAPPTRPFGAVSDAAFAHGGATMGRRHFELNHGGEQSSRSGATDYLTCDLVNLQ